MAAANPSLMADRPTASSTSLSQSIAELEGVGNVRASQLRGIGIGTLGELIEYFPRDYQFESEEKPIASLRAEEIGIARGEVTAVNYIAGRGRPRFEATLSQEQERLSLVFFNGAYLRRQIHPGLMLRVRGMVRYFRGLPQMSNPKWEIVAESTEAIADSKLRPIYPASGRLTSEVIDRLIQANAEHALAAVPEWFAPELLARRKLMGRAEAYRAIHHPKDQRQAVSARRRLIYDELMLMQVGLAMSHRLSNDRISAPVLRIDKTLDRRIQARFPFDLTEAQKGAIWEIVGDIKSGRPMKRLLQGDVGSGKTVVALYAILVTIANKMQAVLLAPTEVLAEQHFLTMKSLLRDSRVNVDLVTSRTRRQAKSTLSERLASGEIHLAVGTQALLEETIEFGNLGLIVVDEQHRLGVRQRATLTDKATCPHYLVMTATPIPRTLALSYFADFQLSVIEQLPPGRLPIQTKWLRQSQSAKAYAFLRERAGEGRQAYIVLPQIDDDGGEEAKSVTRHLARLTAGPLAGLRLAALHGQLSAEEKQRTMSAFRAGEIDALVATTVIEVGIDVPNAAVMIIEEAERFGLSQLHQLRGRVGRGAHPSHCILMSDSVSDGATDRLSAMVSTSSGFEIAEMDLKLRGPGEFFGTRQHGLPELKLADLTSEMDLLLLAKEDAQALLADDPRLSKSIHMPLRAAVLKQFGETLGLAQIG
ncbi:MAG: ATP-dependent DNA helicase RecG [Planctomycetota bacterium]|nr:ATP-dependent DNA helicase RecG [Planctomycetota bacterium]